jgi:Tfp pilus assembly PilM family ATPase
MLGATIKSRMTPIGIDIGETALRGAQLKRGSEAFIITTLAQADRVPVVSARAAGPPEGLERLLARLLSHSAFKGRRVITALNPPEVEFHVLEVPQAALQGGENADNVIHWEIGRLTSHTAEQVETRHWLLPSRTGGAANAIGVSARRDAVMAQLAMCNRGGMRCSCVDTGATALNRFGRLLRAWGQDEIWGLLDLGSRQSRLILCLGESPILIRHTGEGGHSWTERIAEVLQISPAAAEVQKKAHGVAVVARREGRDNAPLVPHDEVAMLLVGALRGELNEMAGEIKRSYEYVLNSYPGRRAGDLVLVGGGAGMPNLAMLLSGILGITVRRASSYQSDPHCRIQCGAAMRGTMEEFATAIGLAVPESGL